nr:MAG TPA: hypothetical protein [Podoviridae sp. ctY3D12]
MQLSPFTFNRLGCHCNVVSDVLASRKPIVSSPPGPYNLPPSPINTMLLPCSSNMLPSIVVDFIMPLTITVTLSLDIFIG